MKRAVRYIRTASFAALLAACVVLWGVSASAVGPGAAVPGAGVAVAGEPRVGQPVKAVFDLKGYELPGGSYASVNVRFVEKPDGAKPQVRAGYPETILIFDAPGRYRADFILNEVSKPSCGGVDARLLAEETVELRVSE